VSRTTKTTNINCRFNTTVWSSGTRVYTTGGDGNTSSNNPPNSNTDVASTCPSYRDTCSSNYASALETVFGHTSPNNELIDDKHFKDMYDIIHSIASERNISDIEAISSLVAPGKLVDHDHYNTMKWWADNVVATTGSVTYRSRGNLIDNASMTTLKNKLKAVARLCNQNDHNSCPSVCKCNTVCTCNCNANY